MHFSKRVMNSRLDALHHALEVAPVSAPEVRGLCWVTNFSVKVVHAEGLLLGPVVVLQNVLRQFLLDRKGFIEHGRCRLDAAEGRLCFGERGAVSIARTPQYLLLDRGYVRCEVMQATDASTAKHWLWDVSKYNRRGISVMSDKKVERSRLLSLHFLILFELIIYEI